MNKVDPDGLRSQDPYRNITDRAWLSHFNDMAWKPIPRPVPNYSLVKWINEAHKVRDRAMFMDVGGGYGGGPGGGYTYQLTWFYDQVAPGKPMDFKRLYKSSGDPGAYFTAADYGNFNYGVIGRALGYDAKFLLEAAGLGAMLSGGRTYSSKNGPAHGDQPRDQYFIRQGIAWHDRNYPQSRN